MIRVDPPDEIELEWWPTAVAVLKMTTPTGNFSAYALDRDEADQLRRDLAWAMTDLDDCLGLQPGTLPGAPPRPPTNNRAARKEQP